MLDVFEQLGVVVCALGLGILTDFVFEQALQAADLLAFDLAQELQSVALFLEDVVELGLDELVLWDLH